MILKKNLKRRAECTMMHKLVTAVSGFSTVFTVVNWYHKTLKSVSWSLNILIISIERHEVLDKA